MARRTLSLSSLFLLANALLVFALPASAQQFRAVGPVPAGARVTLELDKPYYFLGENALIHVCLENAGSTPFSYSYGSENEGAPGSKIFTFTVTGPDGRPAAASASPVADCLEGVVATEVLEPSKKRYWSLPLVKYCRLDEPGTYTVRIRHDFGWTESPEHPLPVSTMQLTFIMPTQSQARQVIADMDAHAAPSYGVREGKSAPYADFSALRYPVYLSLLRDRAQAQDKTTYETALQGIGSIPTPDATQALLELACDPNLNRALPAVQTLNARLPDPALQGKLIHRSPFIDPTTSARLFLSHSAWRPRFVPATRALAHRLLASSYSPAVIDAAFILECVGPNDDMPALTSALDTAIQQAPPVPVFDGSYPRTYGACTELERATLAQIQAGVQITLSPQSPAEQDEYLQALMAQPAHRPLDWARQCLFMLDSPVAYIRARTLTTLATISPLPMSVTDVLRERLPAFLLDPNEDIQVGACALAMKIKDPAFRAPVLQAMSQAKDFPLPNTLTIAAFTQGAEWDALKFWADHLNDPARKQNALGFLESLLHPLQGGGYDSNYDVTTGAALIARWNAFLATHRQEIAQGKRYSPDNPEVQVLFPKTIYMFGGGRF